MLLPERKWANPPEESIRLLGWNCYVGNSPARVRRRLRRWLRKKLPDVVVLNEAMRFHREIRAVARELGYEFLGQEPLPRDRSPRPERGNTVLLVREQDDLRLVCHRFAEMSEGWTVWSHDQRHDPRVHAVAVLRGRGGRWLVVGDHWATRGNRAAQAESAAWLAGRAAKGGGRTVVASAGDKNKGGRELRGLYPRALVRGGGVDWLLAWGASSARTRALGRGGSDHRARLHEVFR